MKSCGKLCDKKHLSPRDGQIRAGRPGCPHQHPNWHHIIALLLRVLMLSLVLMLVVL